MDIRELQQKCWQTAEDKGFHDDRPKRSQYDTRDAYNKALANWQGNKLLLMVSEVVEAHDELRSGRAADETYYPTQTPGDWSDVPIRHKPEGVPSELADTVIRVLDFCGTEGIDLQSIIEEKLAYNATRERLHGRKF
jgi:NTP pyrophosphatase (non-canonical NTP hydrolase)